MSTRTRILAVEDDRINQVVLRTLFKQLAVDAEMVATGAEALSIISTRHDEFSLVLMDLGLPDEEGCEVARKIRALEKNAGLNPIPICAVTGHNTPEKRVLCREAGMNDFLAKPLLIQHLEKLLNSMDA